MLFKNYFFIPVTIPLWVFTLGKYILEKGNLRVPYRNISTMAIGLIIPLGIGFLIQKKYPKLCKRMVRITKTFSSILILFIVIFAIITNFYLFKLFSWRVSDICKLIFMNIVLTVTIKTYNFRLF